MLKLVFAVGICDTSDVPQPPVTVPDAVKFSSKYWQEPSIATVMLAGQEMVGAAQPRMTWSENEQLAVRPASSVAVSVTV